jgi:hypothetical protein
MHDCLRDKLKRVIGSDLAGVTMKYIQSPIKRLDWDEVCATNGKAPRFYTAWKPSSMPMSGRVWVWFEAVRKSKMYGMEQPESLRWRIRRRSGPLAGSLFPDLNTITPAEILRRNHERHAWALQNPFM